MKNNLTIKEISELAGVSKTTVSFVLNNRKGISEKTRDRVMGVIAEENYTPNINSRRLILKRSFNIAFVTNTEFSLFSDFFVMETMKAIVESSGALGYSIVMLPQLTESDDSSLAHSIKQGNIDGVVFNHDISLKLYKEIHESQIPLVVIDSHIPDPPYSCIRVDYEQSAYTAVKYLIDCGHKDIAYIGIERLPDLYNMCLNGYMRAMSEAALSTRQKWVDGKAYCESDVSGVMERLMQGPKTPTAIFCGNDILSVGAIRYAYHKGYRIPEDISFISIDDIPLAQYTNPALTSIHIDAATMGRLAIEMLHNQIEGKQECLIHVLSCDQLAKRETVAIRS